MNQTFIDDKFSFKTILWYAHNLPFINDERKLHTNEMDVIVDHITVQRHLTC